MIALNAGQKHLVISSVITVTGPKAAAVPVTVILQPDDATGLDAYIQDNVPAGNTGTNTQLYIGYNVGIKIRSVIKFDLSSIPAGATILSAVLSLYANQDVTTNPVTIRVYRLKRAWVESQVTWNIYSTGNNWQTAGGFGVNDCEQTDIGSVNLSDTETMNQFKNITLTPVTKADLDLGNGWLLKTDSEGNGGYRFASSDNATPSSRPKLTITYI